MKKTVILSTNDNESYFSYLNYTRRAWNFFGWDTLTFYLGSKEIVQDEKNKVVKLAQSKQFRPETLVQTSRLFGHKYCDGLLMTSDVDMIPLSNYWHPSTGDITCYGHDLTHYQQIPICYIAMDSTQWNKIIPEDSLEDLLGKYPCAISDDWMTWWTTDQAIITERLNKVSYKRIDRGFTKGLAKGRIDKVRWDETLLNSDIKVDCHLPRVFNKEQTESVFDLIKE